MEGSRGGGRTAGVKGGGGVGGLFPCVVQLSDPPGTLQGLPVFPAFQRAGAFGEDACQSLIDWWLQKIHHLLRCSVFVYSLLVSLTYLYLKEVKEVNFFLETQMNSRRLRLAWLSPEVQSKVRHRLSCRERTPPTSLYPESGRL